jgi:anaerobic carbon-monoxide dehydrogenase iron sulfur subunit
LAHRLIEIDPAGCTGCRLCEMACSFQHHGECGTSRSRMRVVKDDEFGHHLLIQCQQCAEPECVGVCPSEALRRDSRSGIVVLEAELCTGCGACFEVCSIGALFSDPETGAAIKCDLCGGDPECVKFCSREVLTVREVDPASPARRSFRDELASRVAELRAEAGPIPDPPWPMGAN